MATQAENAEAFRQLHLRSTPLVLPNAWDVASARLFEDAGFPAVATSSAGMMVSLGYPDGEQIPKREYLAAIARIAGRLTVPLSADVVAGFGRGARSVAGMVSAVIATGAVGINLEDFDPRRERLFPVSSQVRKIQAIRALAVERGVPLVINARTDALWKGSGTPEAMTRDAIRRCVAYRDAGADCVYPMRLSEGPAIGAFVEAVQCPVNVMVRPGLPPLAELERLGVKRVSFGPSASYAALGLLRRASEEVRAHGTYSLLTEGALTFDELNRLAGPRAPAPS